MTWMQLGGGHAEYMLAYADACTLLPDELDYLHAAPLLCAGFTISSGYHNASPKPQETIAVLGMGGLGHLAIQFAKAKGHHVIAITEHEDKKALCKQLGADDVLVATSNSGIMLKNMGGADIILDCASSNTMAKEALSGLKPEGRFVVMGLDTKPLEVNTVNLIHTQSKIIGSTQNHRSDLVDILNLAAKGLVKPMIEIFSLDECNKALEKLKDQKLHFRAVFKVDK